MSLPVKKRTTIATSPPPEASDGPALARCGLDLLSSVVDLHPQRLDRMPSRESPEGAEASVAAGGADRARAESPLQRDKKFPEILMDILSNDEYSPAIGWLPCGERFLIRDPTKFTSDILPKHFRHGINFLSFRRKLNRYGFNAVRHCVAKSGPMFEHKHFRRDRPDLLGRVYCKPKRPSDNTNLAKSSDAHNGAAKAVAKGHGAAGAVATAGQVTRGVPVLAPSTNYHAVTPSHDAAIALAKADSTQASGGKLIPLINSTKNSMTSNHAVAPSHGIAIAAAAATQVPRTVPVSVTNSAKSSIASFSARAPSCNALVSAGALDIHAVAQSYSAASAVAAAGGVPRGEPLHAHDKAFRDLLESELLMRQLEQRRQRALVRLLLDARVPARGGGL